MRAGAGELGRTWTPTNPADLTGRFREFSAAEDTCTAVTVSPQDELLHRVACGWHDAGLFNIILTPNYSANYRDIIHADLTSGSNFMR